jgi:hypothetical protein
VGANDREKLAGFLNHLNGLNNNIGVTMGKEEDGHFPFLYIGIYIGHSIPQDHLYQSLHTPELTPASVCASLN